MAPSSPTETDREGQQRGGEDPFARTSANGRKLRAPAIPVGCQAVDFGLSSKMIFGRIARRPIPPLTRATPGSSPRGRLFHPRGKGILAHALQPGCARSCARFSPACSFPVPLRNRLIRTCSCRLKFPVPCPRAPATGGLQIRQHHDIAELSGTERRPRRKKIPCWQGIRIVGDGPSARRFWAESEED